MSFFFDSENFDINDLLARIKSIKSLKEVIEQTGISQPTFSKWKTRNSIPKSDDLYKIACCLGVTMEWLLTGKNEVNKELPESEQKLLENYRLLDNLGKNHVDLIVAALVGK